MVVEIVGDAAGQPAYRLHLLRLAQRVLGLRAPLRFSPQRRQRGAFPPGASATSKLRVNKAIVAGMPNIR